MKRIFFIITLFISIYGNAQAHLGSTLEELKEMHPDKTFTIDYANSGKKFASADMTYGTFSYYFNKETGLTDFCIQIPNNITALNALVEIYNKKYVIVSETSWKAYLDGGAILYINLIYSEENKLSYFSYEQ